MTRSETISSKLGKPGEVQTNWGKAERWQFTDRISIVRWHDDAVYVCFIPTPEQDKRELEWRAGDQSQWFRESYPEYKDIHTCFFNHPKMQSFEEWLDSLIAARGPGYITDCNDPECPGCPGCALHPDFKNTTFFQHQEVVKQIRARFPEKNDAEVLEWASYKIRSDEAEATKVEREVINQYIAGDFMYSVFYYGAWVWPAFNPDEDRFYDGYWQCYIQPVAESATNPDALEATSAFSTEREALKFVRDHMVKQLNLQFKGA